MNRAFRRKLIYLTLIAALIAPLAMISRPATVAVGAAQAGTGGKLAQLRASLKLGQAQLGRVDPTSSAIRYVSLGLHGLAACILWNKADEYQKQEDWISLTAVLNQLTYLQPYYVRVWTYQSWNVSYNISSQWDDYRDRYYWVVRGFKLLHQGMEYNELEPQFPYDLGWMISHKIGQSDEWHEFRRLFAADDDFHHLPWTAWVQERDNWLFGKRYLEFAEELVDRRGAILRSTGPEIFYMQPALNQSLYGQTIEREGTFGESARRAWRQAEADWKHYGEREFPSEHGFLFRFDELRPLEDRLAELSVKLDALTPGVRDVKEAEKRAALPDDSRRALDIPEGTRTTAEQRLAGAAELQIAVTDLEAAEGAAVDRRDEARRLAQETTLLRDKLQAVKNARHTFNYDYWLARSEMETTDEALSARELFYRAAAESNEKPWDARRTFEEAFKRWRVILDKYPKMVNDQTSYDVYEMIQAYRRVLAQLDEPFDKQKFILRDLLEQYETISP